MRDEAQARVDAERAADEARVRAEAEAAADGGPELVLEAGKEANVSSSEKRSV
jgi:hypothetical protein